jgi:signal peptidase I
MDFYGPFYVPKKGDKISLTDKNIALYLKCIINENKQVEKGGEGLMVNGTSMSTYEFKENYYFMLGDNRSNSMDSRFWGLVPEKLIVGKPLYILWSETFNRIGQQIQ